MAHQAREKPRRLGLKLRQIRRALGLTQEGLIRRLGFKDLVQGTISAYESNSREPSLIFLLTMARLANVSVEALIDDELDLPEKLPAKSKSEGVRRAPRRKRSAPSGTIR
ncbi:MAG: Helix-turn-helix domain [Acidobacteriota bacterium]|jgi:transcriptional regulator with XRE-family HTH domain|nr:Helix-turn-helix domain [Acidobacteriota bacterium]